jgi:DNA-binding NtrC family response regulator
LGAAEALREAGFRVVAAATVDAANSALEAGPGPRTTVTDIDLGGERLNGLAPAKAVAARWPGFAVLLVSGFVDAGTEALPQGARVFRESFEPATLVSAARELVAARHQLTPAPWSAGCSTRPP